MAYNHDMTVREQMQPETDRLKAEIEHLNEIIRADKPEALSFDTLLYIGRRLLKEVYPADIFTGESGDSGPQYVVALRAAIDRIDREDIKC